jgi:hypothetical protein
MTVQEEFNQFKGGIRLMKWEIKWKQGKVITEAPTIEAAIKKFKELGIDVPEKEISICNFGK